MLSKVTEIISNGDWEGQFGKMYSFIYTFEDGVKLKANHKTSVARFIVGDTVEYTVQKDDEYGKQGKVEAPQDNGGQAVPASRGASKPSYDDSARQLLIVKQSSLKAAIDYMAIHGGNGTTELLATADIFVGWVMKGEKPMDEPKPTQVTQQAEPVSALEQADNEADQATAHLKSDHPF